jgi:DNA polymerase-1
VVARTIELPNVRKLFIPDPGYIIAEADLAGADAQVVAWESNDEKLKAAFRAGLKIHAVNAKDMFGEKAGPDGKKQPYYLFAKKGVHATNYGASVRRVSEALGISMQAAADFQSRWFFLHPGILDWHERTEHQLQTTRSVANKFGFRFRFFERVSGVLPEALAWVPQSTVAITINKGIENVTNHLPQIIPLLQVHDSFVFQYPKSEHPHILNEIHKQMEIVIPYDDPLVIPVSIKTSNISWGHCE